MGDRAQVAVGRGAYVNGATVHLYTHGGGWRLMEDVLRALRRRERWDDAEYLARIVLCEMILGREKNVERVSAETGFGIGVRAHGDLEHGLIYLDVRSQTLWILSEDDEEKQFGFDAAVASENAERDVLSAYGSSRPPNDPDEYSKNWPPKDMKEVEA